jgi:hypothetical protein
MKPVKFSMSDQSPRNAMDRYLDVATVMSFPAEVSSEATDTSSTQRTSAMPRTISQPQMRSQAATQNPTNATNVYRAASARTKPNITSEPVEKNQPVAVPNAILRLSVIGPEVLMQDTSDDFDLVVYNTSTGVAKDIVVQMQVSEDLTIVDFDRKAFLNDKDRTVSWKIDSMSGGSKEVIRFRAVSASTGRHLQNVAIGMSNTFQGSTPFTAVVVENTDAESRQRPDFEK